jgi:cob(I)alamin adenosyltransferase
MPALTHLYFGSGKGKSTAAFGMALRFLGRGKKVGIIQFLKSPQTQFGQYGEITALSKFPECKIKQFGEKVWAVKGAVSKESSSQAKSALVEFSNWVSGGVFDLVVADEILYCIDLEVLSQTEIISSLKNKSAQTEVVLTGSHKFPEKIAALADYVTEFKNHKHPFEKGVIAREGVEY